MEIGTSKVNLITVLQHPYHVITVIYDAPPNQRSDLIDCSGFYCWMCNLRISASRVPTDRASKPSARYLLRLSCTGLRSHYHCAPRTLKVISNNLLCLPQSSPTAHSKISQRRDTRQHVCILNKKGR